jgi:hypothetical protein
MPAVLDEDCANHSAEELLRDHRLSRRQISFAMSTNELA